METKCPIPFQTAYWVIGGNLMAGPHPAGVWEYAPRDIGQRLFDCGVRHFVDLTEPHEVGKYVRGLGAVGGNPPASQFTYANFPVRDFSAPKKNVVVAILDYIDGRVAGGGGAAYVHCYAGVGRTGVIVGTYLARHGVVVGEAALSHIRAIRARCRGSPHYMDSPQTPVQVRAVLRWGEGE